MPFQKGFSLIEIMIGVMIVAVVSTISAVSLMTAQKTGRDAQRRADLKIIQGAIQKFYADNNYYPADNLINSPGEPFTSNQITYISSIPKDPSSGKSYCYSSLISVNNPAPCQGKNCQYYSLCANLESPDSAEISNPPCSCGTPSVNYNYQVNPL